MRLPTPASARLISFCAAATMVLVPYSVQKPVHGAIWYCRPSLSITSNGIWPLASGGASGYGAFMASTRCRFIKLMPPTVPGNERRIWRTRSHRGFQQRVVVDIEQAHLDGFRPARQHNAHAP